MRFDVCSLASLFMLGAACAHRPAPPAAALAAAPLQVTLPCPDAPLRSVTTFLDGTLVAVVSGEKRTGLFQARILATADLSERGVYPVDGGSSARHPIDVLPDGTLLISDGHVIRGENASGHAFTASLADLGMVYPPAVRALPTGNWIASHDAVAVALVDGAGRVLVGSDLRVRAWTVSADGERLAVVRFAPERRLVTLDIHDGRTGAILSSRDAAPEESFDRLLYAPDHHALLINRRGGTRHALLDGTTGETVHTFGYPSRRSATGIGFTEQGEVVLSAEGLEVWSPATRRPTVMVPWAYQRPDEPRPEACEFDEETFPCPPAAEGMVGYASRTWADQGSAVRYAVLPGDPGVSDPKNQSGYAVQNGDSATLSPDGTRLLVLMRGQRSSEVRTWDVEHGTLLSIVPVPMPTDIGKRFAQNVAGTEALLVTTWVTSAQWDVGLPEPEHASWRQAGLLFDVRTGGLLATVPDGYAVRGFRADGAMLTVGCR